MLRIQFLFEFSKIKDDGRRQNSGATSHNFMKLHMIFGVA